jgi:hypothetical protein
MKCRALLLFLGVLCASAQSHAGGWPDAEESLKAYTPVVYVAEEGENYGGLCVRLSNADVQGAQAQVEIVTALEAAQSDLNIHELHMMHFPERKFDDMSFLSAVPALRLLSLGGSNFDRSEIAKLSQLKKLHTLYISGAGWDKAGLEALGKVDSIRGLRAQCLRADWQFFPNLPNLEELDLGNSDFDEAGAKALLKSTSLRRIHIYETKINDSGFLALAKVESLKFVGLSPPGHPDGTISAEAIEEFRKLRPDVSLNVERPKTPHPPKAPGQPRRPNAPGRLALR